MLELHNFYEAAIRALAPNAVWCLFNNSLEGIEWRSTKIDQPAVEDIEAKTQELYDAYVESYVEEEHPSPPVIG